jgi:NhaP-type Na+/H+ or K+/H+ antiporter
MPPAHPDPVKIMSARDWIGWLKITGVIGAVTAATLLLAAIHRPPHPPHHAAAILVARLAISIGLTALGVHLHRRWLARARRQQAT